MRSQQEAFQKQWNSLTGSNFEKSLVLLSDFAGFDLSNIESGQYLIEKAPIAFDDNHYAELVHEFIEGLLFYFGENVSIASLKLLSFVPLLKEELEDNPLLPTDTLYQLLDFISMEESGLSYDKVPISLSKYFVDTRVVTEFHPAMTFEELQAIFEDNIKYFSNNYTSVEIQCLIDMIFRKDKVRSCNDRIVKELSQVTNNSIFILVEKFTDAIIALDEELISRFLKNEYLMKSVFFIPIITITSLLLKNAGEKQAIICVDLLKRLNLIREPMDLNSTLHTNNFFHNTRNAHHWSNQITLLNQNIAFAKPLLLAIIQTDIDATNLFRDLLAFPSKEYPKNLVDFFLTLPAINCHEILRQAIKQNGTSEITSISKLLKVIPQGKIDLSKQDSELGDTCLHEASKNSNIIPLDIYKLLSYDNNCLFVRNKENKFAADYRVVWPLHKYTFRAQALALAAVAYAEEEHPNTGLIRDVFKCIAFHLALLHCGHEPLTSLDLDDERENYWEPLVSS